MISIKIYDVFSTNCAKIVIILRQNQHFIVKLFKLSFPSQNVSKLNTEFEMWWEFLLLFLKRKKY